VNINVMSRLYNSLEWYKRVYRVYIMRDYGIMYLWDFMTIVLGST